MPFGGVFGYYIGWFYMMLPRSNAYVQVIYIHNRAVDAIIAMIRYLDSSQMDELVAYRVLLQSIQLPFVHSIVHSQ
jgi:hypothetical protein